MRPEFDFEIAALLRARELRVGALGKAEIESDRDSEEIDRQESRTTLPSEVRSGETYEDVEIATIVRARARRAL